MSKKTEVNKQVKVRPQESNPKEWKIVLGQDKTVVFTSVFSQWAERMH